MNNLKILQVTPYFSPPMGGAAVVPYDIARFLAQQGHQVTVVTSDYAMNAARFPEQPFELKIFPNLIARWGFYVTPSLSKWLHRNLPGFQVIHLHTVRTFQNVVAASRARHENLPYIIQAHGTLPVIMARQPAKRVFDLLYGRRLLREARYCLAVSGLEVEQYTSFGIPIEKIARLSNGLDLAEFSRLPEPGTYRRQLGISPGKKIILFLGRLHPIKGLDQLIQAFASVLTDLPETLLILAGPDEGDRDRLQRIAAGLSIQNAVLFPGPVYGVDKLAALADADVVSYPSAYEIFGLVPFEAVMCGTPVVVSKESGMGQLITQSGAGDVFPHGDVIALGYTLKQVLMNAAEAHTRLVSGQAYIRQRMAWPVIIHQLEELYAACISA